MIYDRVFYQNRFKGLAGYGFRGLIKLRRVFGNKDLDRINRMNMIKNLEKSMISISSKSCLSRQKIISDKVW